jgi:hypothetical protein
MSAQVKLTLTSQITGPNEPVALSVEIDDPPSGMGVPRLPSVNGLNIQGPAGPSQQTSIIHNVRSYSVTYRFVITPKLNQKGSFKIGPVQIPVSGGDDLFSQALTLQVVDRPGGNKVMLLVETERDTGRIAVPMMVTYTILYSGKLYLGSGDGLSLLSRERYPMGLRALDIPLLSRDDIEWIAALAIPGVHHEVITTANGDRYAAQETQRVVDGVGYDGISFAFQITPMEAGPLELGRASATIMLESGTRIGRDVWGRRQRIRDGRPFSANSDSHFVEIAPLPSEGLPKGFSGAIGQFSIDASTELTTVDTFSPIDVTIRIIGKGNLDRLRLPDWQAFDEITANFDVSSDVDAGTLEGNIKTFHQTLRPKSPDITEIPPLPFPFFDPNKDRYQVAYSKAIPIKVRAVETVSASDAIVKSQGLQSEDSDQLQPVTTQTIVARSGIGANFDKPGTVAVGLNPADRLLAGAFVPVMTAPVAVYFGVLLLGWMKHRDPQRVRAGSAQRKALQQIDDAGSNVELILRGYTSYFRDRLMLPAGELTPRDIEIALAEHGVNGDLATRCSKTLDGLLSHRFGGAAVGVDLAGEVRDRIREVERCLP